MQYAISIYGAKGFKKKTLLRGNRQQMQELNKDSYFYHHSILFLLIYRLVINLKILLNLLFVLDIVP